MRNEKEYEEFKNFKPNDADVKYVDIPKVIKTTQQIKREFYEKMEYLRHSPRLASLDLEEIGLREFIWWIFERNIGHKKFVEPFEDVMSDEYQQWLQQKRAKKEKIDYTGYACWRYNPIVFYREGKENKHRILLHDDEETLEFIEQREFALLSPVTYVGRNNTAANARYLYAFAFDLDGVGTTQIMKLCWMVEEGDLPMPNLITNSGHGLHLYYLLEHPVPMYKENIALLNKMKHGLTNVIWNEWTSTDIYTQHQGVVQGFRLPGTLTKFGEKICSFHCRQSSMHTIEELNNYLSQFKLKDEEVEQLYKEPYYDPTGVTREEAKKRWPEWYASKIERKGRIGKKWHVKRDVYDWWLNRLWDADTEIKVNHRYWCILTLVIYAVKCDIPRDEVLADAYSLVPKMEKYTVSADNHFTKEDVDDAMKAYDEQYNTWPIDTIETTTLFRIDRNRRNGRGREKHLKVMNFVRDNIAFPDGDWRKGNGRKPESEKVAAWRAENPESNNKSACARDTGLDRKTVRKWWSASEE